MAEQQFVPLIGAEQRDIDYDTLPALRGGLETGASINISVAGISPA